MTDRARQAPWVAAAMLAPLSAATFAGTVAWAAPDRAQATASVTASPAPTAVSATGDEVDERIRRESARVARLRAEVARLRGQVADARTVGTGRTTTRRPAPGRPGPPASSATPRAGITPPPVDVTTGAS
jgi:hypothetical protein